MTITKNSSLKYELLLLLMSLLWGSTFAAQQIGMEKGLGPMTFNALRFALGALCLLPVLSLFDKEETKKAPSSFPWLGSLSCGILLFAAASFQQIGLLTTSCANGGFITGLYILFVPLIGLFLGQRPPTSLWLGMTVSIIGLYFLSVTDELTIEKGDLLMLICALMWAGQILMIDKVSNSGSPIRIACVQFTACAFLSGFAALLFESLTIDQLISGGGAVAYAGILSVGIAFTLQVICQRRCPPARAAVIMSLEAVFAALTGYLVMGQSLGYRAILGCALCFLGMLIVQLIPLMRSKQKVHP